MAECFRCGISENKAYLMDAITNEGIQKICRKCSFQEEIPIIKAPSEKKLEDSEKTPSVYQRMQKVSGIHEKDMRERFIQEHKPEIKEDGNLRELVEKNFKQNFKESVVHDDLIDNFHWAIMRARRLQKITIEQLAARINESVSAVKLAEQGILSSGYSDLIKKLEGFLGISLFKKIPGSEKQERKIEVVEDEILGKPDIVFEKANSGNLTVEDLRRMKEKHEEKIIGSIPPTRSREEFVLNENVNEDDFEFVEDLGESKKENKERVSLRNAAKERDLTKEEIDRILYGKD